MNKFPAYLIQNKIKKLVNRKAECESGAGSGSVTFWQCYGSMTFWCGSGSSDPCLWLMDPDPDPGSGSGYFRHWPSRCQQKTNFLKQFFLLITFWRYIYIIFPDPDPYHWLMDPDPDGPKTCGPGGFGSGSATLLFGLLDPDPDPLVRGIY